MLFLWKFVFQDFEAHHKAPQGRYSSARYSFLVGSKERRSFEKLTPFRLIEEKRRKKGDFFHNTKILKSGCGMMIVCRQSDKNTKHNSPHCYIPCKFCLGFFCITDIRRHCGRCIHRKKEENLEQNLLGIKSQCELLLYPHKEPVGGSLELQEFVIRPMNNDDIKELLLKDDLILTYGSFIVSGKGVKKPLSAEDD